MFVSILRHSLTNRAKTMLLRSPNRNFRAAVLFHGSGVYDGTETTEAVAILVGLSRLGAQV